MMASIEKNPRTLTAKQEFIASQIINISTYPDGTRYATYFTKRGVGKGLATDLCDKTHILIYTWARYPSDCLDEFITSAHSVTVADILIRRELVGRFTNSAKKLFRELHADELAQLLPQKCLLKINREVVTVQQEIEQVTEFAIALLQRNSIHMLKKYITEDEYY